MNNTNKTKTFIAFINKEKKDTYWINGNYCFDEDVPKIYPYESKEEKKDAIDIGKRLGVWDETSDIDAVLFKVVGEPFSVITKREAAEYEKVLSAEAAQRVAERKAKELEEKKPKKETSKVLEHDPIAFVSTPKESPKVLTDGPISGGVSTAPSIPKPKVEVVGVKTRGRPKISFEE